MEQQHYSPDYQPKKTVFPILAISFRCSAVKFEIHAWLLASSFFFEAFFVLYELFSGVLSLGVFWLSFFFIPRNLCLAAVARLGGNGFSGYRDWGKWDPRGCVGRADSVCSWLRDAAWPVAMPSAVSQHVPSQISNWKRCWWKVFCFPDLMLASPKTSRLHGHVSRPVNTWACAHAFL